MLVRRNQNWLPEMFNNLFDAAITPTFGSGKPAVNVIEKEGEYDVELAAPGMTKDDFTVRLDEDENLVVELEKKTENEQKDEATHYLRHEFSMTKFRQTLLLPDDVDRDAISARVDNGVLYVTLPKLSAPAKRESKQIAIS